MIIQWPGAHARHAPAPARQIPHQSFSHFTLRFSRLQVLVKVQ